MSDIMVIETNKGEYMKDQYITRLEQLDNGQEELYDGERDIILDIINIMK